MSPTLLLDPYCTHLNRMASPIHRSSQRGNAEKSKVRQPGRDAHTNTLTATTHVSDRIRGVSTVHMESRVTLFGKERTSITRIYTLRFYTTRPITQMIEIYDSLTTRG